MRHLLVGLLVLVLTACASDAATRPPAAPSPAAVPASTVATPPAPAGASAPAATRAYRERLEAFAAAVRNGDLDTAAALLADARTFVDGKRPRLDTIVYYEATLHAYRGHLAEAVATLLAHLEQGDVPADPGMRFGYHNALIMVRTAQADLAGAFGECAAMVEAGQAPPFTDDAEGRTMVLLKQHWHEAYLWRMVAEVMNGRYRGAALHAAMAAREAYRALATPLGTYGDSIAVLDGFFAIHDGRQDDALAAARLVKVGENADIEDLYLTQMAFAFGGDAVSSANVRARIAALDEPSLAVPIIATWLDRDARAASGGPVLWSPRHPRGAHE